MTRTELDMKKPSPTLPGKAMPSDSSSKEDTLSVNEVLRTVNDSVSETSINVVSNLQENVGRKKVHEEEEDQPSIDVKTGRPRDKTEQVTYYLARRKIGDLMLFMMQHLLINEPGDPVGFLQQLMDKCLMFRSGILCSAPLLFEDRHIDSLYQSLDPLATGSISRNQYHVGMQTLGLKKNQYEMEPEVLSDGTVGKQVFLTNAKMALVESLMDMILLPPPMEDGESSLETFYH